MTFWSSKVENLIYLFWGDIIQPWHIVIILSHYFKKIYLFIYLFLAVLGLCSCVWAFTSCCKLGLLSRCDVQASHCGGFSCCWAQALGYVGSGAGTHRLQSKGSVVVVDELSCPGSMWNLPRPGIELMSLALTGRFFTTGIPGKSKPTILNLFII